MKMKKILLLLAFFLSFSSQENIGKPDHLEEIEPGVFVAKSANSNPVRVENGIFILDQTNLDTELSKHNFLLLRWFHPKS